MDKCKKIECDDAIRALRNGESSVELQRRSENFDSDQILYIKGELCVREEVAERDRFSFISEILVKIIFLIFIFSIIYVWFVL